MKNTIAKLAVSTTLLAFAAVPAAADKCEDVRIMVRNYDEQMTIFQVRFFNHDSSKWKTARNKNWTAITTGNGPTFSSRTMDFKKARGNRVTARIKYRRRFGSNNTKYYSDSRTYNCYDGRVIWVTIPANAHNVL